MSDPPRPDPHRRVDPRTDPHRRPDPRRRPEPTPEEKFARSIVIVGGIVIVGIAAFFLQSPRVGPVHEIASEPAAPRETRPSPDGDRLPVFGEFVHVDRLPEAIQRKAPVYPDRARERGHEGQVVVHALVGKDGRVVETRIVQSDPDFDAAAEAAVRQWTFAPARSAGKPVAVWVAIPIRFRLD